VDRLYIKYRCHPQAAPSAARPASALALAGQVGDSGLAFLWLDPRQPGLDGPWTLAQRNHFLTRIMQSRIALLFAEILALE
jgi:hypothetical protein